MGLRCQSEAASSPPGIRFDFDEANHAVRVGWNWRPVNRRKYWAALELMVANYGQAVPHEAIDDICIRYAHDDFDGPLDLAGVKRVMVCDLRKILEGSNHAIVTYRGYGYGLHPSASAPRKSGRRLARYGERQATHIAED